IIFMIMFAIFCIAFINLFSMPTPFHVIERPIIQLLILAPIIEELVYRYVFVACQHRFGFGYRGVALTNSFLFAGAHLLAIPTVPSEFYPFLIFQGIYTFILSLALIKSLHVQKTVLAPILLHFIFNGVFYLAM